MGQAATASKPREEMTAEQARRTWGDVVNKVSLLGHRFVLRRRGKLLVAIVSVADLDTLEKLEAGAPRSDVAAVSATAT